MALRGKQHRCTTCHMTGEHRYTTRPMTWQGHRFFVWWMTWQLAMIGTLSISAHIHTRLHTVGKDARGKDAKTSPTLKISHVPRFSSVQPHLQSHRAAVVGVLAPVRQVQRRHLVLWDPALLSDLLRPEGTHPSGSHKSLEHMQASSQTHHRISSHKCSNTQVSHTGFSWTRANEGLSRVPFVVTSGEIQRE